VQSIDSASFAELLPVHRNSPNMILPSLRDLRQVFPGRCSPYFTAPQLRYLPNSLS